VLSELAVTDLGVIRQLSLVLAEGMTAVTGETGAGKTLVVEAIELLVGGRADPAMVRHGADEAVVEGRFVVGTDEVVVRRVVPAEGRSRAYIDGTLATAGALAELGSTLVDLHGQHDHQSLLSPAVQRDALDRFGAIELEPLAQARRHLAELDGQLSELGGDDRARAREIDLLRFQVEELEAADLSDPDEDEGLARQEDALADALAHQEAALAAQDALDADEGAIAGIARALAALDGRGPFVETVEQLRSLEADLVDAASTVRAQGEAIEDDPARLEEVQQRRRLIHDLQRKYGATLADVIEFQAEATQRLAALADRDRLAAELDQRRAAAIAALGDRQAEVAQARRRAAPALASATQSHLVELAMARARIEVEVGGEAGQDVSFRLAANPGSPLRPLVKVASGGELARTMLALRLVLSAAPPTLIFDEVDAGVGGAAATAVGRALAALAVDHQVLVVTHLPQVAAWAGTQVGIAKLAAPDGSTVTEAHALDDGERQIEVARMLSGSPDSATARCHAAELLASSRL
jgi:DNA repair protein RecN (Recombination protein N)